MYIFSTHIAFETHCAYGAGSRPMRICVSHVGSTPERYSQLYRRQVWAGIQIWIMPPLIIHSTFRKTLHSSLAFIEFFFIIKKNIYWIHVIGFREIFSLLLYWQSWNCNIKKEMKWFYFLELVKRFAATIWWVQRKWV